MARGLETCLEGDFAGFEEATAEVDELLTTVSVEAGVGFDKGYEVVSRNHNVVDNISLETKTAVSAVGVASKELDRTLIYSNVGVGAEGTFYVTEEVVTTGLGGEEGEELGEGHGLAPSQEWGCQTH